jgi:pimeloyl-ACP methyl ester carboxylesterase
MKRLIPFLFFFSLIVSANAQDQSGYFTSFDGTKIYYEVAGKGYPIVLVHGFIVNGEWWKRTPLYPALRDSGYQLISFDMRGNGKSDKPHNAEAYANDAEAKDITGLLHQLKINEYVVVGYSRGSIIATQLLVKDPRIKAAVLGGMGDGFTDPQWPRRLLFYRALSGEKVEELEGMVNYVKQSGLDQQALALLQKEQPSVTPPVLATIRKPVMIINGDNDPGNGSAESLAKMIRGAALKIIPGDHNTTPRSPLYVSTIMQFIKESSQKK